LASVAGRRLSASEARLAGRRDAGSRSTGIAAAVNWFTDRVAGRMEDGIVAGSRLGETEERLAGRRLWGKSEVGTVAAKRLEESVAGRRDGATACGIRLAGRDPVARVAGRSEEGMVAGRRFPMAIESLPAPPRIVTGRVSAEDWKRVEL